jgi:hypothetical protein
MTHRITDELARALDEHNGFLKAEGQQGNVVLLSMARFRELMGVGSDAELAESIQAIQEGLADVDSGRTVPLDHVFRELDDKYGIHG